MSSIWVIIPTYNERENVDRIVNSILSLGLDGISLLFVDDSSPDGTAEKIREIMEASSNVHLIVRPKKLGIGSAYKEGFRYALDRGCELAVTMDADLQHPPEKIPELLAATSAGDVAIGSRYVKGGAIEGWSFGRRLVSWIANYYSRKMLGLEVRDCTSGFRAYNRKAAEIVASSGIKASGFDFQVLTLRYLKDRARFVEVPYIFKARTRGKSKLSVMEVARFFFKVLWEAL